MLFPYAPAYRELIYRKMDEQFDIDWFFCGDIVRPLKILDYSVLNTCDLSMSERSIVKTIHYYKGIRNLNLGKYDIIIAPPVIRCLSIWWLVWKYGNRKSGPKVYFWTHGWYGREKGLVAWLKKLFLQRTDVFLLYNQTAKYLMIDNGFDADKMYVIYNSLNYDKQLPLRQTLFVDTVYSCHFNNNNRNIVFIGRLTREKRFDLLIDAVAELKGKGVMVNVTFIGDGEERKAMERRVEELGVGNQMWFYGACYDEMKNADTSVY